MIAEIFGSLLPLILLIIAIGIGVHSMFKRDIKEVFIAIVIIVFVVVLATSSLLVI